MTTSSDLARLFAHSERIAFFTGAGLSTESGIPDFRSPGGVWSKVQPIQFQDFVASRDARRESWRRVFHRTAGWTGAKPNAGHEAVAKLIQSGRAFCVVTQNVDNLHQNSGVPEDQLVELHGNASHARCLECGRRYEFEELKPRWEADEDLLCETCAGLLKTATISFGQPMPAVAMDRAHEAATLCDLMVVLGSSLVVYPAAGIPIVAKNSGARLAIVNREPTEQDPLADLVLNTELGETLTEAVDAL